MQKFASCSLLIAILISGECLAGTWNDITPRTGSKTYYDANEYLTLGNNKYLECDNDKGDVDSGVFFVRSVVSKSGASAYECYIEDDGDLWRPYTVPWCYTETPSCASYVDWTNNVRLCVKASQKKTYNSDTVVLINGLTSTNGNSSTIESKVACVTCKTGTSRNGDKCEEKKDTTTTNTCTVGGKTYNIGDKIEPDFDCSVLKPRLASATMFFKPLYSALVTGEKCSRVCVKDSYNDVIANLLIKKCPANTTGVPANITQPTGYYSLCKENKTSWKPCKEKFNNPSEERCACWDAKGDTTWTGDEQNGTCTCNDKNFEWNLQEKKCIKKEPSHCDDYYDSYTNYSCCKLQEQGITEFNATTGACKCKKEGAVWDKENAYCIEPTTTDTNNTIPTGPCEYIYKGYIDCPPHGQFSSNTYKITLQPEQLEGMTCSAFNAAHGRDADYARQYFAKWCSETSFTIPNREQIDEAQAKLRSLRDKATVWKDAEGKFNTARLASDMTAGVVLGTVGGVVSGVVIKKKQLEKGFEVLHCAVGGQVVADWGDEFKVVGPGRKQ